MDMNFTIPPSLDDFETIARKAYDVLPRELAQFSDGVVIRIDDFPDAEIEREMDLESPFDLLGLYQGVALGDKSLADTPQGVDMIFLYRRPILDYWCESGEDLQHLIRHVLIHEIGHHFGLSDADMERIESAAEAETA
ncbi:metallopeptidase family protein [Magnetovibrio sp.]|uniref:metallopeptidase family protein n=1 Tax=Magnetovibrio sp. TaxID=2024836 RepID=UPI002F94C202